MSTDEHPQDEPTPYRLPVIPDDRVPMGHAWIAPAGTPLDSDQWTDVGWTDSIRLDADAEWSIGSKGDVAPVLRSLDSLTATYAADLTFHRPRERDLPAVAPLDLFDLIYGDSPRVAPRRDALHALAVACHEAARQDVVRRAEHNALIARIRATMADSPFLFHPNDYDDLARWAARDRMHDYYAYAVLDPADFVRITEV